MRCFIILCVAALVSAGSQGYNYANELNDQQVISTDGGSTLGFPNSIDVSGYQQQPLVSKRFFIHSAPEEEETEIQHHDIVAGTPRNNLNVVFVKTPAAKQQQTRIRVIPAINEDKTAIYVLTKKAEETHVQTIVEETATTTSKPEVFFIKYKTNEEAENAQRSIQAEYDQLGGDSIISNEGIAPVSSVIGSLDGVREEALSEVHESAAGIAVSDNESSQPSSEYLPVVEED